MKIESVAVPAVNTSGRTSKYAELWTALDATKGTSAIAVTGLTSDEAMAAKSTMQASRKSATYKVRARYADGVLTLWFVEKKALPVTRQFTAIG